MPRKKKELAGSSFEGSYSRLEEIVNKLENESDNISLDEVIEYYQEGLKLVKLCRKMLQEAEVKIQKIKKEEIT